MQKKESKSGARDERCASRPSFSISTARKRFKKKLKQDLWWVDELDDVDDDNEDGMHIENRRELITTHKFRRC